MREILFASKKGGTGKSTLCAMVANHLVQSGKQIAVVDCDNCSTLTWRRKSDRKSLPASEQPPYPIITYDEYTGNRGQYEDYDYILLDNSPYASECISRIIVVPFFYSEMVLDSTFRFIKDLKIQNHDKIVFVPNEVAGYKQSIKKKDTVETVNWILGIFGKIMPKVSNGRVLEQVSTIKNTIEQNYLIKNFVDALFPDCPMLDTEIDQSDGQEGEVPSDSIASIE